MKCIDDNGKNHEFGDVYLAPDGCNKCVCKPSGPLCTL